MPQNFYSLLICILISIYSCSESTKTTFFEENISSENNQIVEINIPKAKGNEAIVNQINTEIKNAVASTLQIGEPNHTGSNSITNAISAFNEEYEQFKKDFPETEIPWEAQIDGEVVYKSEEIISLAITSYINTGGAHGISNVTFLNFNAINGERLSNNQLISNLDGFKKLAKTYFDQTISNKEHTVFDTEDFTLPTNMAFTEDGLVLLYNTYEIAPYSTGIIEFKIPFNKAKSYLAFNHF